MAEESFWTKTKRAVKGFVNGVIRSAPLTLATSAATVGLSYALGTYISPDLDLFRATGMSGSQLATKVFGGFIIGSTINGAVQGYHSFNAPEQPAPGETPAQQRNRGEGMGQGQYISMGGLMPPPTPNQGRDNQRVHG